MTAAPPMESTDQQALADEIFRLMVAQGGLFAVDAPIRQSLAHLTTFMARRHQRDEPTMSAAIEAALRDDQRFAREQVDGQVHFVTSRQGRYVARDDTDTHSFRQRLHDPEQPLPIDDISVVVSTSRPAITTVEPVFISDYWQVQVGALAAPEPEEYASEGEQPVTEVEPVPLDPLGGAPTPSEFVLAEIEAESAEPDVQPEPSAFAPEPEILPAAEALEQAEPSVLAPEPEELPVAAEAPVAPEQPFEAPRPVVPEPPAQPLEPVPPPPPPRSAYERSTVFTLADGSAIDLRRPLDELLAEHGPALRQALVEKIEQDPLGRIVSFGSRFFPEANVINLGKNDLRKIREYINERGEPLLDSELIADIFYHNARQSDYEGWLFSLNYRLYREKDFEFVGVEGVNLWSAKGLPNIGGKRVKAAEMGQLTSYLVEGFDDSAEPDELELIDAEGSLTLTLPFFSWEYGVLPLTASIQALLPPPALPDQRSAVLRFDSLQHFSSTLVEVRYPTGNRGGWLQGLEEFFHEHLVPGAVITLSRGTEPNLFVIGYDELEEHEERILTLDEKKNKLGFTNFTYYAAVDAGLLPNQTRFPRLNRLKSFPMGERRKAEMVLEHVAEVMGEQVGSREAPRYAVKLDDLFVAFNVLRPGSLALIRHLIQQHEQFEPDATTPDLFSFTPALSGDDEDEEEEELSLTDIMSDPEPTPRRYGGRYTDDDE
ncbi:hypothetical protein [Candidatus Viridilinea mediisalina]|uniref:Uncharacterized protein n=1 Tax=Candidatus Viridilinea mediisalina TaxID=2024553 RepID=A0A2A6RKG9_9CHLR|nr:hypothetical protein [Candidatus Viridilinea mediisalina]PDW03376.1 hypothetical protein CJ255_08955 [Candidatus Viridilinea mediisalina]